MKLKDREQIMDSIKDSMLIILKKAYSMEDKEVKELLFQLLAIQLNASLLNRKNRSKLKL